MTIDEPAPPEPEGDYEVFSLWDDPSGAGTRIEHVMSVRRRRTAWGLVVIVVLSLAIWTGAVLLLLLH